LPDGLTMASASLPLPTSAGLSFWRDEVARADRTAKTYHSDWDENLQWYTGQSPDAAAMVGKNADFVNVNVDFYQVEQKQATLFYETPELQLTGSGPLRGAEPIVQAHRQLLIASLEEMDILPTVHQAIKDCLCVSGTGPVMLGYQPTLREVQPPEQLGSVLGLAQPIQVPIYEKFFAERFSPKKLLIPSDFTSTEWDKAPWLGMRFRMPLSVARREFAEVLARNPRFEGTTTRDEHILDRDRRSEEATAQPYVDGQVIWYRAASFDDGPVHPELYRELVLIDGINEPARHRDSPHQTILPNGRLSADSLMGNPIHPLTIRTVPDQAYVPSDSQMTRPLVRELCKFRTQMVQERDANRPRILYDTEKLPPEVIAQIEAGTLGSLIGVEGGALAAGITSIMAEVTKGNAPRQAYIANDYIQRDIDKTLAIGPNQAGVNDENEGSATQTAIVDRTAQARQAHEQRQVLRWYLKLVDKLSALVCRYLTPPMVQVYIGPEAAQRWAQWDWRAAESRLVFSAKPDSQIRLDAAAERKFALDVYNFMAKDPNVNRIELLKNLCTKAGLDPSKVVVEQLPEKKPDLKASLAVKGEDFIGPQAPIIVDILRQMGLQITPIAVESASMDVATQIVMGLRDANGQTVTQPEEHGGPAEKTRPLSKQQGEQTGERSGPSA
jgi:hypothetical protein